MVPVFPIDLKAPALTKRSQSPAPHLLNSRKAKASPPPGTATAKRPKNDRPASAPLPLSEREQQVCEYLSQGISFKAIANRLGLSPAAAKEYHRRALDKHQRTIALASAPLEQGESSAPRVRSTAAKLEQAVAKVPCVRPASALPNRCERSPFHSPAVDALAFRERPNAIDRESVTDLSSGYIDVRTCQINLLKIPESLQSLERLPDQSKALEVDESAKRWDFVGRSPNPQTTITDLPRHPFRRKRTSRRSRQAGVGFRVALAS